jgi:large subunit ribosomal protein L25
VPDIVLAADTARPIGTRPSRRLRHTGRVPAVVYGHGVDSTAVSVDARALRAALSTPAGQNAVFELDVDGTRHLAMAKVVDHHPVRHTISHVDFLVISRDQTVSADVPLVLVGESEAVKQAGGLPDQVLHALAVSMLPGNIPDSIEVDISHLELGSTIRVGDVTLPRGVTTDVDADTPVVHIVLPAVAALPEEEAAAAAEEGAAEAPAEGAEPAPAGEAEA